jgi:hypothetical protein
MKPADKKINTVILERMLHEDAGKNGPIHGHKSIDTISKTSDAIKVIRRSMRQLSTLLAAAEAPFAPGNARLLEQADLDGELQHAMDTLWQAGWAIRWHQARRSKAVAGKRSRKAVAK